MAEEVKRSEEKGGNSETNSGIRETNTGVRVKLFYDPGDVPQFRRFSRGSPLVSQMVAQGAFSQYDQTAAVWQNEQETQADDLKQHPEQSFRLSNLSIIAV